MGGSVMAACEACGAPLDGEHPSLCGYCAATIDHDTDAMLERELFDLSRIAESPCCRSSKFPMSPGTRMGGLTTAWLLASPPG
jgi:hypothetical protein